MTDSPSPQPTLELAEPRLESAPIRIKDILVATDFSEQATEAAKVAAGLAKTLSAQLHVVHAGAATCGGGKRAEGLARVYRKGSTVAIHQARGDRTERNADRCHVACG